MLTQGRPRVHFSHCLGFGRCRYNGQTITDPFVERLRPHVDAVTACPEVAIGLGIPREPVRVVEENEKLFVIQPDTGRDVTDTMEAFTESYLDDLGEIDGFVLKYRSPSCGPNQVRIYNSRKPKAGHRNGAGFFGGEVVRRFPGLPIEDEGRLRSFDLRQHFLTRLFTLARLREAIGRGSVHALVEFHTKHKYLLMTYSQEGLRTLGRIVANAEHNPLGQVFSEYREILMRTLARAPRRTAAINTLMHAFGHLSEGLKPVEKAYFLDELERFRNQRVCLSTPVGLLRSWVARFEEPYLTDQYFFEPFPDELVELLDSGKGRALK